MGSKSFKKQESIHKHKAPKSPLSNEESEHLQNIAFNGLMRTIVPPHIEEKFLKHGYIRKATGGMVITDIGHHALINWDRD